MYEQVDLNFEPKKYEKGKKVSIISRKIKEYNSYNELEKK